ncbi:MAG: MMPL family transporter [Pseudomonadota bacterium]
MKRVWTAVAALGILMVLAITTVDVRTDADAVFAPDTLDLNPLDTSVGRELIVALVSADQAERTDLARDIAAMLERDPKVAMVNAGPGSFSDAFLEWVWNRRFRLALPEPADLSVAGLSEHLAEARQSLTSAEGMMFGDRLLRDPTGSFARLLNRFADGVPELAQYDGVWQSRDGEAALLFVTLADRDFETGEIAALTQAVRERAAIADTAVYLLGPRVIAAEISAETSRESTRAALIAIGLLLAWLIWVLRSARALVLAILPMACGFLAGCLATQVLFGSVHVIALGFGGVLTGLALDYALHVLGHPGSSRSNAQRLVLLGAVTTAVGFLAMLGSGVPALMQTGVFVATGLPVAAVFSRTIPSDPDHVLHAPPFERLAWPMPFRPWIEIGFLIAGIAVIAGYSTNTSSTLFDPPDIVAETIDRFETMVDLPSGRHAVMMEASTLSELLARQTELAGVLISAVSDGALDRYAMTSAFLPATATLPTLADRLPDVVVFEERAAQALSANGMEPEFAAEQGVAYSDALHAPVITYAELEAFPETRPLAARLDTTATGLREIVRLYGLIDAEAVAGAVAESEIPGVHMLDLAGPIDDAMVALRHKVLLWLGIGSIVAFAVLLIGHREKRRAVVIARTTGAAVGLTALLMAGIGGPLGIFEIVALTLVFGIGIDYGLFLDRKSDSDQRVADFRSVGLCAVSTMIAFSIMAFSPVKLLHDIGLTVFLGVLVTLVLHSSKTHRFRERTT